MLSVHPTPTVSKKKPESCSDSVKATIKSCLNSGPATRQKLQTTPSMRSVKCSTFRVRKNELCCTCGCCLRPRTLGDYFSQSMVLSITHTCVPALLIHSILSNAKFLHPLQCYVYFFDHCINQGIQYFFVFGTGAVFSFCFKHSPYLTRFPLRSNTNPLSCLSFPTQPTVHGRTFSGQLLPTPSPLSFSLSRSLSLSFWSFT